VIVNEFGEIGIDNDLRRRRRRRSVRDEQWLHMLHRAWRFDPRPRRAPEAARQFDGILIETTGLAIPRRWRRRFFSTIRSAAARRSTLGVTVADAKWLKARLKDAPEAKNQIGFADIIILNKTDLVTPEELHDVESRIRAINPYAKVHRTERCDVPIHPCSGRGPSICSASSRSSRNFSTGDHDHHHEHNDDHHHHNGGPKHYHDEEMQSLSLKKRQAPGSG